MKEYKSKSKQAEEAGAIMIFSDTIAIITKKSHCEAMQFKNDRNDYYILRMKPDFIENKNFKDGKVYMKKDMLNTINFEDSDINKHINDIDIPLLTSVFSIVYNNYDNVKTNCTVDIYLPSLMNKLGINGRGKGLVVLLEKLSKFEHLVGFAPDGSIWRVLEIIEDDRKIDVLKIKSPYMIQLMGELDSSKKYKLLNVDTLMASQMINERDKLAIQIVSYFLTVLRQCGQKKPTKDDRDLYKEKLEVIENIWTKFEIRTNCSSEISEVEKSTLREENRKIYETKKKEVEKILVKTNMINVRVQTIINKIPQFKESLEGKDTNSKNTILKRHFKRAYELFRTKTEAFQYYQNLEINELIPTTKTLSKNVQIKHEGVVKSK